MKALSLLQPWASLWVLGFKTHETRSWYTNHRGPLAVHASKGKDADGRRLYREFMTLAQGSSELPSDFNDLPFGAVVGQVYLDACIPITMRFGPWLSGHDHLDYMLGNYSAGRYAWRAKSGIFFPAPVPCNGALGLWAVPPAIETQFNSILP